MNDFTLKQSTMPLKSYESSTLIGNWFEERCDKKNKDNFFYRERKFVNNQYNKTSLTKENFDNASLNWLNFQKNIPENTFKTTSQVEFKKPDEQFRTSVLKKFITRKDVYEKNPELIEDYRKRWTKSNHVFDRTYLGTIKQ